MSETSEPLTEEPGDEGNDQDAAEGTEASEVQIDEGAVEDAPEGEHEEDADSN